MNLTLWNPEAQRAERRMGTMRKYPGCSPIARPSRSNVFFNQSSMKVALHRLILTPAKHPKTGSPPSLWKITRWHHLVPHTDPHCGRLARGDGRRAPLPELQARHSPSLGEPPLPPLASLSAGQVCPRPGMSRTTDLVLGIPEAPNHPRSLAPGQCNSSHCESPFKTTG